MSRYLNVNRYAFTAKRAKISQDQVQVLSFQTVELHSKFHANTIN